jgi:dTDP-4-dehydrorhamnose 3,5-epimerase
MPTSPQISDLAVQKTSIDGLLVLTMKQVTDERGTVREFFRASAFDGHVLPTLGPWRQINVTQSRRGAIRGLHGEAMTKLVSVVHGAAFGAYVDTRSRSATRGRVVTVPLAEGTQVLVPAGVCNGFQSVSPGGTQYLYCFDAEWVPGMSGVAVNPLDPALGIIWPVPVDPADRSQVSAKDVGLPILAEVLG